MPDRDENGRDAARHVQTPFRLNLDQQKKRARELLKAALGGEEHALARLAAHHPKKPATPRLADAQLVIARELGLSSWPRLKAHVEAMQAALRGIGREAAPDADKKTLHIRCGYDIHDALRMAGFTGDFLEVSDPLVQGPVRPGADWLEHRARFIHGAFGPGVDETLASLRETEQHLAGACRAYERVVIWTEHDAHDQLILARCLARFHDGGRPPVLELAGASDFPGGARFLGIGQLPPEALILLWRARRQLEDGAQALGVRVWAALRQPDPSALAAIAREDDASLPDMRPALRRHLRELPWLGDGLSLTERLTLEIVRDGIAPLGRIFRELLRRDPLPTYGDLGYFDIVRNMLHAAEPPLAVVPATRDDDWPDRALRLTPAGEALLRGARDWRACGPPERWLGGVLICPGAPAWLWDDAGLRPVHGTP
jgi:hypothetical protein